jgi:DNA-binding MarR family transcriptional regulator
MTRRSREDMVEEALKIGARLFRVTLPIVPKEMLELDVTMTQLKILFLLFVDGLKRMSDLAADLGVTLATASGLAERLVERDFITRESQPDDRRVVLCRLTPSGEKAINRIWETAGNRLRDLLRALDTEDVRVLRDILNKMLNSAELERQKTLNT